MDRTLVLSRFKNEAREDLWDLNFENLLFDLSTFLPGEHTPFDKDRSSKGLEDAPEPAGRPFIYEEG